MAWRRWGRCAPSGYWAENRNRCVGMSVVGGQLPAPDTPTVRHSDNRNVDVRSHREERFHPMTTVASPPRNTPAGAEPVTPTRRRNPIPLLILGAVVLSLAGWGVQRYRFGQTHVSSDDAQVDGHITPIAPKVQAFVDRVLVDDNQRVRAGDTLVVLDARPFRARLDQAEAEYRAAL